MSAFLFLFVIVGSNPTAAKRKELGIAPVSSLKTAQNKDERGHEKASLAIPGKNA